MANPSEVKLSATTFHGESVEEWTEFVGWLRVEFLRNASAYPDDPTKGAFAMSMFRGRAMSWLNTFSDPELQSMLGSHDLLIQNLAGEFGLSNALLRANGRAGLDSLAYNHNDPHEFFTQADVYLRWTGYHSDVTKVQTVWHKVPNKVKEALMVRGQTNPNWQQLRDMAVALHYTGGSTASTKRKPKCGTCGKRHSGECRSKK